MKNLSVCALYGCQLTNLKMKEVTASMPFTAATEKEERKRKRQDGDYKAEDEAESAAKRIKREGGEKFVHISTAKYLSGRCFRILVLRWITFTMFHQI